MSGSPRFRRERRKAPEPVPAGAEPSIQEWHALLVGNSGKDPEIQRTIKSLLSSSASGRAYLDLVRRYRPACDDLEATEIIELVTTYEAIELLGRLLNEPRCGGDPDFFLWKDVWGDQRPDPDEYTELIEIAVQMEAHASEEAAKARLRLVRENLERELELERYCRRKELLVRQTGRMGGSVALRS